jgi:hypothetical protein
MGSILDDGLPNTFGEIAADSGKTVNALGASPKETPISARKNGSRIATKRNHFLYRWDGSMEIFE